MGIGTSAYAVCTSCAMGNGYCKYCTQFKRVEKSTTDWNYHDLICCCGNDIGDGKHQYGGWSYYSETKHVRECEDCGYKDYRDHEGSTCTSCSYTNITAAPPTTGSFYTNSNYSTAYADGAYVYTTSSSITLYLGNSQVSTSGAAISNAFFWKRLDGSDKYGGYVSKVAPTSTSPYKFTTTISFDAEGIYEITARVKDATAVLLPVYLNSGSLVNLPIKTTLFIYYLS